MSLAEPIQQNLLPTSGEMEPWAGPRTGFSENVGALYDSQSKVNSQFGLTNMYREELEKRDDQIYALTGKRLGVYATYPEFGDEYRRGVKAYDTVKDMDPTAAGALIQNYEKATATEKEIDALRAQYPDIKDRAAIFADISARRGEIEEKAADVGSRAGAAGVAGGLVGGMAGSMTTNSPLNVATLPVGGFGKTVVRRIGTEALTQMAIAGVDQAFVSKEYERQGEKLPLQQAGVNILFAGAGGAAIRGLHEGGAYIFGKLAKRAEADDATGKLAESLVKAETPEQRAAIMLQAEPEQVAEINEIVNPAQSTLQRGAVQAAETEQFTAAANPFADADGIRGAQVHEKMMNTVQQAIEAGEPLPAPVSDMPTLVNDIYKRVPVENFGAENLTVDAPAMQFKSGGDDAGVTDRLKGTKEWNDYLAGVITVWKKDDGSVVVADGHQRVGLAKRIMSENPDKKITIPAFVFSEKAGDTEQFVRAAAALRNISEGSGSALDAAKVFRDMPARAKMVFDSLPPNSQIVKQGNALAALDNEAYAMVVNGVVDEKIGAVVGRLEADHNAQRALMALLAHEEPDTIFQAEQIVRQAQAAGFQTSEQQTLFGSESVTESLFKDKAKVLERGLRLIKDDVKTFRNLLAKQERITEAGNTLDQDANAAMLGDANTILQTVQALAYRKGPVADALTDAAKEAKNNGRYKNAAERFVESLRSRLDEGGVSGLFDATTGDISDVAAEVAGRIESETAAGNVETIHDLFAEQPKTVEAGFNQLKEVRDAQAAPASRKAESDAGGAPINSPKSTFSVGSQSLDAGLKISERKPPSGFFSTAKNSPEILTGGKAKRDINGSLATSKQYHVANNKAKLIAKAKEYEKPLADWLTEQVEDIKGAEFNSVRTKALKDIDNKLKGKGREANQISDYLGARIVVDSLDAADKVKERLATEAHAVEVDDFLRDGREDRGYRAIHMQLEAKDGFSYEVQIIPRDVMDVYEKARPAYEKWKQYRGDIPKELEAQALKDKAKADKIMTKGWQKFQERDLQAQRIAAFDVNERVPVAIEFDTDGREVIKTASLGDLMKEVEAHESLLEHMNKCLI